MAPIAQTSHRPAHTASCEIASAIRIATVHDPQGEYHKTTILIREEHSPIADAETIDAALAGGFDDIANVLSGELLHAGAYSSYSGR